MSHLILFLYIVLIASGAGGVVALALLHYRLRTKVTGAFVIANSGLLASLLLVLVTFYVDSVLAVPVQAGPFALSPVRTLLGLALGLLVYWAFGHAMIQLPGMPKSVVLGATGLVRLAMIAQSALIVSGNAELAVRLGPVYMYVLSASLLVLGILLARRGNAAPTETMSWFLVRLGYLTAGFAVISALFYTALDLIPALRELQISLDFFYYLLWSALSIAAFVRYLTRPSAFVENDEISDSFITAYGITPRESEVVGLISQGLSNQEIADRMNVSFATARTHVYNIFQKTGAGSRVDLLRLVSGYRE